MRSMKDCHKHDYKPAYWRSAEPSYKRCSECGDIKTGTDLEIAYWAKHSPWKNQMADTKPNETINQSVKTSSDGSWGRVLFWIFELTLYTSAVLYACHPSRW